MPLGEKLPQRHCIFFFSYGCIKELGLSEGEWLLSETSRASDDNSPIEIRISDTGGGIPEEILPRLFEKFATKDVGDSANHGTGLGLYISKAIINAHNGKVSAFNDPEGGATFIVSLPTRQER